MNIAHILAPAPALAPAPSQGHRKRMCERNDEDEQQRGYKKTKQDTRPQCVLILVGLPGSGKSTLAAHIVSNFPSFVRVSRDELGSKEKCTIFAKSQLVIGRDLVIDRCNFNSSQRSIWMKLAKEYGCSFHCIVIGGASSTSASKGVDSSTIDACMKRAATRSQHEGGLNETSLGVTEVHDIVRDIARQYVPPNVVEGFGKILQLELDAPTAVTESFVREVTLATATPAPTSAPAPFVFNGTWEQMAYDVMDKATKGEVNGFLPIKLETAAKNMTQWKKAVKECVATDVDSLWAHLLVYFRDSWTYENSTRMTAMGAVKAITGRLGIPEHGEFQDYYEEVVAQHQKDDNMKVIPLEEAKAKFGCKDGTVLTTKKLRTIVDEWDGCIYQRMLLSFFAYHGNRSQDWCVGFGEENTNKNGYYDPTTQTMHLFKGKTQEQGTERVFQVHEKVAECIAKVQSAKPSPHLVPNSKGDCGNTKTIRDKLNTICKHSKILPTRICPNDLRHLFATHIRYVDILYRNKRLKLMSGIAHSDSMSLKNYAQTYRPMVEWAEANEQ